MHKDGYNVLYGDWSAKWYGDPQQRLIWWDNIYVMARWPNWPSAQGGGNHNIISDYDNSPTHTPDDIYHCGGAVLRWHLFDVSAGVDVGVDGL